MATRASPGGLRLPLIAGAVPRGWLAALWRPAVLATMAVWLLLVGAAHEPWFDEAQAWLIVRDSGLVQLLFERVRYEGTPGLWHAILWLAMRAGLPYDQLYLVSGGFALAGAAVVLWRAPFPAWMRCGVIFSYFFAYQFAVVARSYAVDLLLLPLAAAFFADRTEKPLPYALVIGLLAHLNAHSFLIAAVLGLEFAWQLLRSGGLRRASGWIAPGLAAGLGLLALVCLWQPADNHSTREPEYLLARPLMEAIIDFRHAFIDRVLLFGSAEFSLVELFANLLLLGVVLGPLIGLIAKGPHRILCGVVAGVLLAMSALVYGSPWHSGLLWLVGIVCLWISWPAEASSLRRNALIAFGVIVAVQFVQTARTGMLDWQQPYSPSADAAEYIRDYRAAHPGARVSALGMKAFAIQPWHDGNLYDGIAGMAYVDWRRDAPWDPYFSQAGLRAVIAEQPDLIVAAAQGFTDTDEETPAAMCRRGYRTVRRFEGTLFFRGDALEDNSLLMLERTGTGNCR